MPIAIEEIKRGVEPVQQEKRGAKRSGATAGLGNQPRDMGRSGFLRFLPVRRLAQTVVKAQTQGQTGQFFRCSYYSNPKKYQY